MSAEIEQATGIRPELIAGDGGIFDVAQDGELLFSKRQTGRFPTTGEVTTLIN